MDVSGIRVNIMSNRFDQEFFALDFDRPDAYQKLYQKYGNFAADYTDYLLSFEPPTGKNPALPAAAISQRTLP